jgi:hypothetical protein
MIARHHRPALPESPHLFGFDQIQPCLGDVIPFMPIRRNLAIGVRSGMLARM